MLVIRFQRVGRSKRPFYRIIVQEKKLSPRGKFVSLVGHYDPIKKTASVKKEEVLKWMDKGALPSNSVAKIFKLQGLKHKAIIIKQFHKKSKQDLKKEPSQKPKTENESPASGSSENKLTQSEKSEPDREGRSAGKDDNNQTKTGQSKSN